MSELVPFFSEDEVLDDNLLRSIETLLDDNEQNSIVMSGEKMAPADNGMVHPAMNSPMPQFQPMNNSFAFGSQVYQKWSTNESGEALNASKRNYGRNQSRAPHFVRPAKKYSPPTSPTGIPAMRANVQIAQYQAMLAEKANQLLTQYLRLNYENLNAQAQILGVSMEQYIRNLLIALNNQSLLMPSQPFMFAPMNPLQMPMPANITQQQRAFAKQYFNKKN